MFSDYDHGIVVRASWIGVGLHQISFTPVSKEQNIMGRLDNSMNMQVFLLK